MAPSVRKLAEQGKWGLLQKRAWALVSSLSAPRLSSAAEAETLAILGISLLRADEIEHAKRIADRVLVGLKHSSGWSQDATLLSTALVGAVLSRQGHAEESLSLMGSYLDVESDVRLNWADLFSQCVLCISLLRAGRRRSLVPRLGRIASAAMKGSWYSLAADAHAVASIASLRLREVEMAERFGRRAAELYARTGDIAAAAGTSLNAAARLATRGYLSAARRALADARQWIEKGGLTNTRYKYEVFSGWVNLRSLEIGASEERLEAALSHFISAGVEVFAGLALDYLTEMAILKGDLDLAASRLRLIDDRCSRMLSARDDFRVGVGARRALLMLAKGDHAGAAREASMWAQEASRVGLRWEEAQLRRIAGTALAWQQRVRDALSEMARSEELFGETGEQIEARVARAWMQAMVSTLSGGTSTELENEVAAGLGEMERAAQVA